MHPRSCALRRDASWMAAMTGKEIREVLDQARVLPSKQLGQNFLIDPNMARWIVAQLEISEDDAMSRLDAVLRFSTSIRSLGCGIMVSGFGRRSATFMPLKTLRPDFVKVDGVIVRKLLSAPAAEAKLKAILRVGEVMGFQTIGEMVEEQDILVRLKALGVGYAQGFGIQPPHPIEKLAS